MGDENPFPGSISIDLSPGILSGSAPLDRGTVRGSLARWAGETFELWHREEKRAGPAWYAEVPDTYPAERLERLLDRFDASKSIDSLVALGDEHRAAIERVLHTLVALAPNPAYDEHQSLQPADQHEADAAALESAADHLRRRPLMFYPARLADDLRRRAAVVRMQADILRDRLQPKDPHRRGGLKSGALAGVVEILQQDLQGIAGRGRDRLVAALVSDFYGAKLTKDRIGGRRRDRKRRGRG